MWCHIPMFPRRPQVFLQAREEVVRRYGERSCAGDVRESRQTVNSRRTRCADNGLPRLHVGG